MMKTQRKTHSPCNSGTGYASTLKPWNNTPGTPTQKSSADSNSFGQQSPSRNPFGGASNSPSNTNGSSSSLLGMMAGQNSVQPQGFQQQLQPQMTGFQQPQSTGFQQLQPQMTGFQQPQVTGFNQTTGFPQQQQAPFL